MPSERIDLLAQSPSEIPPQPHRPHTARWFFVFLGLLFIGVGLAFAWRVLSSTTNILGGQTSSPKSVISQIRGLVTSSNNPLRGEGDGRTNILLIGHGGAGHSGRYLSDTIILVSYDYAEERLAMMSIPRDLYVNIPGHRWGKINNALAFGFDDGNKEQLLIDTIEDITGQDIHYFVRADFNGFKSIVDSLGGVTVNVERSFKDYAYPDNNFGYQTISFQSGEQIMNGETALKFARSRHGNNNEGSDFARSQRQQKILFAIKEKVLSASTLLNPPKILALMDSLGETVSTNFEIWEALAFYDHIKGFSEDDMIQRVIDNSEKGPLHSYISPTDGAYLLSPNRGVDDFSEIHEIAAHIFEVSDIEEERAAILIQNGTLRNGLASAVSEALKTDHFHIVGAENAQRQDFEKTVIYDLTLGQKPETLSELVERFHANVSTVIPSWLLPTPPETITVEEQAPILPANVNESETPIDFVIILGQDTALSKEL